MSRNPAAREVAILCPEIFSHQDGGTHGNTHNQKNKDIHDRPCRPDGSQSFLAVELSDYHGIHCVVELLEQIAEYKGNRIGQHMSGNASLGHIARHSMKTSSSSIKRKSQRQCTPHYTKQIIRAQEKMIKKLYLSFLCCSVRHFLPQYRKYRGIVVE